MTNKNTNELEQAGGARVRSQCVGKTKKECVPPCSYVICTRRANYCGAVPAPLTPQQKEASVRKAAATRAKNPYKRVISPEEHERRSLSAKRAAAATRQRRAASLPAALSHNST
jgi:hypothetical protein